VFAGPASDYTLTHEADGSFTVHGPGGSASTLSGIERLRFDDRHLALDVDANTASVAGLYQAAFGRSADEGGFEYYGALLDDGALDWMQMARNFLASPEYARLYGGLSDEAFVTQLYHNALGREPDPEGFAYQVARLAQLPDGDDRAALLIGFAQSPEMLAKFGGIADQGLPLL
jgi:serralysin